MAKSRFEYVREFERRDFLLPECYIVVRVDGKKFHQLSNYYGFEKPNDMRALKLMNASAKNVVMQYRSEIILAYGESDEYSFLLRKDTNLYNRRADKISSLFVSLFTSQYVILWHNFFTNISLDVKHAPFFDSRCILYPNLNSLKDYLSWRFVDTHINNLYNTAFWGLVQKCGLTTREAENRLSGTVSSEKQEILFSECGTNYNNEPDMYKKGSLITDKGEILHIDIMKKREELFAGY